MSDCQGPPILSFFRPIWWNHGYRSHAIGGILTPTFEPGLAQKKWTLPFHPQCPLVAESGPSKSRISSGLNDRFGEKRTLGGRDSISVLRMAGLPPEADIELESRKRSANDPKWT